MFSPVLDMCGYHSNNIQREFVGIGFEDILSSLVKIWTNAETDHYSMS